MDDADDPIKGLENAARESAEALRALAGTLRRGGGLVPDDPGTLTVSQLRRLAVSISDVAVLRRLWDAEAAGRAREGVSEALAERLRLLGAPVALPAQPWPGFAEAEEHELLETLAAADAKLAASTYAYEFWSRRRAGVLAAARQRAGADEAERAAHAARPRLRVEAAALDEPWSGFSALRTSAGGRTALRAELASRSLEELEAASAYERATAGRQQMLLEIKREQERRG